MKCLTLFIFIILHKIIKKKFKSFYKIISFLFLNIPIGYLYLILMYNIMFVVDTLCWIQFVYILYDVELNK